MELLCAEGRRKIEVVRDRLYREDRLSGDQMRDLAQTLEAALADLIPYEPPDPEPHGYVPIVRY